MLEIVQKYRKLPDFRTIFKYKYNNDHERVPWCSEGLENLFFKKGKNGLAKSRKS